MVAEPAAWFPRIHRRVRGTFGTLPRWRRCVADARTGDETAPGRLPPVRRVQAIGRTAAWDGRAAAKGSGDTMKIATWNVNGIRARAGQLVEWIATEQPDVLCLQEIKATPEQIPGLLPGFDNYWTCWHGVKAYSGVSLHVRRGVTASAPVFTNPRFDYECRIVETRVEGVVFTSVYVPNGGKDFDAKLRFLDALAGYANELTSAGTPLVMCGDMNVARTDIDVHPRERKPRAIGQLPEERRLLEQILDQGIVDVTRALRPDDEDFFTWWAPWRNLRQRNIGWRIDYVLATTSLAARATSCESQREVGTSDHAPLVVTLDAP